MLFIHGMYLILILIHVLKHSVRCRPTAPLAAPVAILVLARLTSLYLGPCVTNPLVLSHFHFQDVASTPGHSYFSLALMSALCCDAGLILSFI